MPRAHGTVHSPFDGICTEQQKGIMAQDDYDGGYCTCSKCKAWDVAAKGKYRVVLCSKHGFDVEVQNTA